MERNTLYKLVLFLAICLAFAGLIYSYPNQISIENAHTVIDKFITAVNPNLRKEKEYTKILNEQWCTKQLAGKEIESSQFQDCVDEGMLNPTKAYKAFFGENTREEWEDLSLTEKEVAIEKVKIMSLLF